MAQTGSSSQKSDSKPVSPSLTNPLDIAFSNLFGQQFSFGQPGRKMHEGNRAFFLSNDPGDVDPGGALAPQIFGPDTFSTLLDQLAPVQNSGFGALANQNLHGANECYGNTSELLQNELSPGAYNVTNNGLPTDLDPIIAQQLNQFRSQMIPELANQFGFLGGGGQNRLSSDFGAAAANAAGGIATNLGALQVDLDEASAERQLSGLQLAGQFGQLLPEIGQLSAAFPAALGSDILSLEEQNFDFNLLQRQGGQFMNLLNNLVGISQPDPILGQVSSGGGSSSNVGVL